MKACAVITLVGLLASIAAFAPQTAFGANAVRISQVYGGGGNTGATYNRDYVELFNSSGVPLNIGGWSLQYGSATGTINLGTCSNCLTVIPQGATIPAYGYYLIALAQGTSSAPSLPVTPDLDVPVATANNLGATAGKIGLKTDAEAAGTPCGAQAFVDLVGWGSTANCFETAPAASPSNSSMAVRNNGGFTDTDNNSSDFTIVAAAVPHDSSSPINTFTITASTQPNGSISPSGPVSVSYGSDQTFTITPDQGYRVAIVLVDGSSVGAVESYTFTNVVANHSIIARFESDQPPVSTIGLFFDPWGTVRDAQVPPSSSGSLYVIADGLQGLGAGVPGCPAQNGISGAEFRIEGWPATMSASISFDNANVYIGDPLQDGVNIAYPNCQGPKVILCRIDYHAFGQVPPTTIAVTAHRYPSNPFFPWPQVVACDAPCYTRARVTPGQATINSGGGCESDTEPPSITAPPDQTVECDPPPANPADATASDNCSTPTVVVSDTNIGDGSASNPRIITRRFTATDAAGNSAFDDQIITVADGTPPMIGCPANIVTTTDPGSCTGAVVSFAPTVQDNCTGATFACSPASGTAFPLGTTTVSCTAQDAHGNGSNCSFTVTVSSNPPPSATITAPPRGSVYPAGTPVTFTGTFTDNAGDSHTAQWIFSTISQAISQTGVVDETGGSVSGTHAFTAAGLYKVQLRVTDQCGGSGVATTVNGENALVLVYDPSNGWVTGVGLFDSPPGAYSADPSLEGRVSVEFVSSYVGGSNVLTGNTRIEFTFVHPIMRFISTAYEQLIVSEGDGSAQFWGSGRINGAGDYGFEVWTIDGQVVGGSDKIRVKIWDKTTHAVVYDSQLGSMDEDPPTTETFPSSHGDPDPIRIHHGGSSASPRRSDDEAIPSRTVLYQTRVDPSNPLVTLEFELAAPELVSLKVYDIRGRVVGVLANRWSYEAGHHAAVFDTSALASGVYLYRLDAGRYASTKRMVILK